MNVQGRAVGKLGHGLQRLQLVRSRVRRWGLVLLICTYIYSCRLCTPFRACRSHLPVVLDQLAALLLLLLLLLWS